MSWDWEKLKQQQQQQRRGGGTPPRPPQVDEMVQKFKNFKLPGGPIILIILAGLAVIGYGQYQDYRTAEQLKAQQLIIEQQRIVSEQREALGDLPEAVLSEQGQRNLAGETYNTTRPRSEKISASIDQQNGVRLATAQFKCDERQHCSQMSSEILYYCGRTAFSAL